MIKQETDTRQQRINARRELLNEHMCSLGNALNALPQDVAIEGARIDAYGGVSIYVDADSFEVLFAGREVSVRRDLGWIDGTYSGGELDGVHFHASHSRYKHPVQPKDETITLPEVTL